jgi:hypothetical protein
MRQSGGFDLSMGNARATVGAMAAGHPFWRLKNFSKSNYVSYDNFTDANHEKGQ